MPNEQLRTLELNLKRFEEHGDSTKENLAVLPKRQPPQVVQEQESSG
jgi:hypothetical protein